MARTKHFYHSTTKTGRGTVTPGRYPQEEGGRQRRSKGRVTETEVKQESTGGCSLDGGRSGVSSKSVPP